MTIEPNLKQHIDNVDMQRPPHSMVKPSVDMTLVALARWLGRHSAKKVSSKQSKPTHTIH